MQSIFRTATRGSAFRAVARPAPLTLNRAAAFSTTVPRRAGGEHAEETFEEFTARYGFPCPPIANISPVSRAERGTSDLENRGVA